MMSMNDHIGISSHFLIHATCRMFRSYLVSPSSLFGFGPLDATKSLAFVVEHIELAAFFLGGKVHFGEGLERVVKEWHT